MDEKGNVASGELTLTERIGDEHRHWIFKIKGRSQRASLDRYWSRRQTVDGYESAGWYRANAKARTLEIKDVPRPSNQAELIAWCQRHQTSVPKFGKAPRLPKEPKPKGKRGRPAGSVVKGSISDKIRKALLRDPEIDTAKLMKKYGVSRQLISQVRKSIRSA